MSKKHIIPAVLCLLFITSLLCGCTATGGQTEGTGNGPEQVVITLVDIAGNAREVDLTTLPATTGQGGYIKSSGTIAGPATFTGPRLLEVLDLIGGLTADQALQISAGDGYTMTLSREQAGGHVMTYDLEGKALKVGGMEALLGLQSDDAEILDAAPRIVFIGTEARLSDGHFWIKNVAAIKVVPAVEEWALKLSGIEETAIDRPTFESVATCGNSPHPMQQFSTTNKQGDNLLYEGVPLWVIVSMIDGADDEHYQFNRELSRKGYTVQVIAADGYTVELASAEVADNDSIFLAYLRNGEPLPEDSGPVQLVGSGLEKGQWVKQVAEIRLTNLP